MSDLVQLSFDYSVLPPDQAQRTQEAEYRIIGRTQKTIIENGRDLLAVKRDIGHGHFINWIRSLGISEDTAQRWMNVADSFKAIEIPQTAVFDKTALYLLSGSKVPGTARTEAKERAETGEKITEEIARQIRDAHQARELAEKQADRVQQELFQTRVESHETAAQLNKQIEMLQNQISTMSAPQVEIKEVTPPIVSQQLADLQAKVKKLTEQRDNLAKEAERLGEQNRQAVLKRNEEEVNERYRQWWRSLTNDFHAVLNRASEQWPNAIRLQRFDEEDWTRLENMQKRAQRFIDDCNNLRQVTTMIIDAE